MAISFWDHWRKWTTCMLFVDALISNPIMYMPLLNIFLILYYMIYKVHTVEKNLICQFCQNLIYPVSFQLGRKGHSKIWNNKISRATFVFSSVAQNHDSSLSGSSYHLCSTLMPMTLDLQISQFYMKRSFISEEMQTLKLYGFVTESQVHVSHASKSQNSKHQSYERFVDWEGANGEDGRLNDSSNLSCSLD